MIINTVVILSISVLSEDIKNIIESVAILAGGIWALYRFGLFREKFPSMEILNGITYIGENQSEYLLDLYCIVENKGRVRKWIAPFDFKLKGLSNRDEFKRGDEKISWQVQMNYLEISKDMNIERRYWVSPDWYIPFVDGESKRCFHYLTAIPKSIDYLSLYSRFIDFNNKDAAVDYILIEEASSKSGDKNSDNKKFEERVQDVKNMKTDFYYTRITVSIESLKANSAKAHID